MKTIEIARRMAQLGETGEALRAYAIVLHEDGAPEELLEAAAYTLQNGGDYKIAYTAFVALYRAGQFREETLGVLTQAFYEPNIGELKVCYERNRKLLSKYPYLFRRDFPDFDDLPLKFYPYDETGGCVSFDTRTGEFGEFVNVKDRIVSRNFFKDLSKPIFASDVYSQYELEYLNDNVRPSEWCARENHIYLHYTDWEEFCSWLQVLNLRPLVKSEKAVFLIGDERAEYPIDFKKRFGLDYSRYKPRPIGLREVNRLIWHTQFSSHNGGDFFNEIFDSHPNLITTTSLMFDEIQEKIGELRGKLDEIRVHPGRPVFRDDRGGRIFQKVYELGDATEKDLFVAVFLAVEGYSNEGDPTARIAPALFFQPHFGDICYELAVNERGDTVLSCEELERIRSCEWIRQFKYIKTFTPLRRPTASHGGSVRAMLRMASGEEAPKKGDEDRIFVATDAVSGRVLNRGYLRDPDDPLYHDAVIVRFEDGKLDPEATFTRLAAFLDLPYTETMTYCSDKGQRDPKEFETNVVGFDTATVYNTYDGYVNDNERRYIEFFLRDAYEYYGYDFRTYDGGPVDLERVKGWVNGFDTINEHIRESWLAAYDKMIEQAALPNFADEKALREGGYEAWTEMVERFIRGENENRIEVGKTLLRELRFVNRRGQPLRMTPMLEPDPALMKNPRYH